MNFNAEAAIETLAQTCIEGTDCSTSNLGLGSKFANYDSFKNEIAIQAVLGLMYILVWGCVIVKKYHSDRELEM